MEFLRGVLGIIGIACAFMLGRSAAAVRKRQVRPTRMYGWIIRTVLCLGAVLIRHDVDVAAIAIWAAAAAALGFAYWEASRVRKDEDLTPTIFPGDE